MKVTENDIISKVSPALKFWVLISNEAPAR